MELLKFHGISCDLQKLDKIPQKIIWVCGIALVSTELQNINIDIFHDRTTVLH